MEKPNTLTDVIRYFADEDVCVKTVVEMRWPNGVACPACGHMQHWYLAKQRRWKCKECWKQFTCKLGTIFEDSPLPLSKWLVAIWLITSCKNGISSYEIGRSIGVSQKSAWHMMHRIRMALRGGSIEKLGGPDSTVEVDETYVGARSTAMHKSRRLAMRQEWNKTPDYKRGERYMGKTAVFGMLDRDARKVRATVVPNVKRTTLQGEILSQVEHGTQIYSDESTVYDGLAKKYTHDVVNHLEGYVNGRVHTNGIENFWSLLKRSIGGTYVAVEPFHLQRYVNEQVFRYNNRKRDGKKIPDAERFQLALKGVSGKRLTYAEVTGKVGETTPF